jgi:hypothetical protein
MATDWSGFWYDDSTQETFFKPPCKHEPLDIGFPSRTVWCRSCSVYLKLEDGKWVTK